MRAIRDGAASGVWNMAVDEALLEAARTRGAPPDAGEVRLRLYGWDGPWLSLGRRQRLDARRAAACAQAGVGVVRRASGGGAVLHGADLTYAIAAPVELFPAGLRASYELLAGVLVDVLGRLGADVSRQPTPAPAASGVGFDCFAERAGDEIHIAGRKLVGSAQRRTGGGLLQHGSIRLSPDPPEVARSAGVDPRHSTSLAELGVEVPREEVEGQLATALAERLGRTLQWGGLADDELARARELVRRPRSFTNRSLPDDGASRAPASRR